MALLQVHFSSKALGLSTSMNVLLPEASAHGGFPVLYLLHGWSDDETTWMRRTSIERYANAAGLAVIMPRVDLSYYQNTASGMDYWTFLSEELPALCHTWFPLTEERAKTFTAGLSMGGYGAMRLALSFPEKFSAAASLSGALDLNYPLRRISPANPDRAPKMKAIFGSEGTPLPTGADLFELATKVAAKGNAPRLFQCCGTSDFLYEDNLKFRDHAHTLGLDLHYEEGPGDHEWGYWDTTIQRAITWFTAPPVVN